MNEYALGSYESLGAYTVVFFPENKIIPPKKAHEIYGLGQ